ERAFVAVAPQVQLQALQLDAGLIGNVDDADGGEVGLPRHRAHAGEFRAFEADFVVSSRAGIREGSQGLAWFCHLSRLQVGFHRASHGGPRTRKPPAAATLWTTPNGCGKV